jgi:hypothetical protein
MLRLGASAARAAPSCSFGETAADDAGYGLEAPGFEEETLPQHRIHPLPAPARNRSAKHNGADHPLSPSRPSEGWWSSQSGD